MKLTKLLTLLLIGGLSLSSCSSSKYMRKFKRKAKKEATGATVKLKRDTLHVVYPEVAMFDFGKDEIKENVKPSLKRFAGVLSDFDRIDFTINGHTDTIGTDEVNQPLSQRRAEAAKTLFESNGVSGSRMQTNGMGSKDPIATNTTEVGRMKNRRVEFLMYQRK